MSASNIEWTEPTWNPVTGCTKVSSGCQHGYAEAMVLRLHALAAPGYGRGFELTRPEDRLGQPRGCKKPTVYFVGSMADLFHEDVSDAFLDRVLAVARQTSRHTDLLLTKRAERLPAFFASRPVPPNVGLGVTVEDRRYGLLHIDRLRQVPACIRCFKPWGAWGPDGGAPRQKGQRPAAGRPAVGRATGVERGAGSAGCGASSYPSCGIGSLNSGRGAPSEAAPRQMAGDRPEIA